MKPRTEGPARRGGFTTAEILVAMGASSLVLGGLMVAMTSLSRTFSATESYGRSQSAQMRIIDTVAMDLRRAVAIAITTSATSNPAAAGNAATKFAYVEGGNNWRTIQDGTFDPVNNRVGGGSNPSTYLTLTIPGFYQSNSASAAAYRQVTSLISTGRAVRYGTSAGVAPDVTVQYRQAYVPAFGSECFIRREAGVDTVIAEKVEFLDLDITARDQSSFIVETWFTPTYSNLRFRSAARVTSSDRVMLRNPRKD